MIKGPAWANRSLNNKKQKNKTCIIVDDIIDSGGTIVNAVDALKKNGANEVYVFITHGKWCGKKLKIKIKKLIITDTIITIKK